MKENGMFQADEKNAYLVSHVDEAVANGWIRVYYQPIYDALSRNVFAFEALARWADPALGLMAPDEFTPVLENAYLLYKIDLFVLEQACREIQRRRKQGGAMYASINLSRKDLDIPDFHERVNALVDRYEVPHGAISFELAETALVKHEDAIRRHIAAFHEDGYRVWLDDFGSGYNSLNALQHFDFDFMKIDRRFLQKSTDGTKDVLSDIVDLSKKLGIHCSMEGVETKRQMDLLVDTGCYYLQGYYIARPEPIGTLEQTLKEKDIGMETEEDHEFFKELSLVNVLFKADPYIGKGFEPSESPKMVTILLWEEGGLRTLYTNETGKRWLRERGVRTEAEVNKQNDQGLLEVYQTLRDTTSQLRVRGEIAEGYFHDASFPGKLRSQLITSQGGRKAFLITSFRIENMAAEFNFEDLADGVPGAVLIYQAHGDERIFYANEECIRLFGCGDMDDFLKLTKGSFHTMVHPDDIDRVEKSVWNQISDTVNRHRDYVVYHVLCKDGSEKVLLNAGHLIHHQQYGDIFFVILMDLETMSRLFADANRMRSESVPRFLSGEAQQYILDTYTSAVHEGFIRLGYKLYEDQLCHKIALAEACPEWNDPERGRFDRNLLTSALDDSSLIHELDRFMAGIVATQMERLMQERFNCVPTMIEISPRTFIDPHFHEELNELLRAHAIPHQMLILKFRGFDVMKTPDESKRALEAFHQDGYQIAMNVEQSFFSSSTMLFLKDFMLDYVELVLDDDAFTSEKARIFLKDTANSLVSVGITPLAAGVREKSSKAYLKSIGCFLIEAPGGEQELYYTDDEIAKVYPEEKFETIDEFHFYRDIGRVNVLAYQKSVPGESLQYSISASVFAIRGDEIQTLYLSPNSEQWFRQVGTPPSEDAQWMEVHAKDENMIHLWNAQEELKHIGDMTSYYYATQKYHWTVRLKLIAICEDTRAFLADTAVLGKQNDDWLSKFYPSREDNRKMVMRSVDGANISMFWMNEHGVFVGANQRFLHFYGTTFQQLIGKTSREMGRVVDEEKYEALEQLVLREGKSVQVPLSIRVNEQVRRVLFFANPVFTQGKITGLYGIFSDVTALSDKLMSLEQAAKRDALTGLRNRRTLDTDLDHMAGHHIFVQMMDIDHFKDFNDTYGHRYGDETLRIVSHALDQTYGLARCYRYGGDEFLVIGTCTSMEEVKENDTLFRTSLASRQIIDITLPIHTSCGVAFGTPKTREEINALVTRADENLYRAKKAGRNQTCYGDADA